MKITDSWLIEQDACLDGIRAFRAYFPNGFEITKKNINKAFKFYSDGANLHLGWMVKHLLSREDEIQFGQWAWWNEDNHPQMLEFVWDRLVAKYGSKIIKKSTKKTPVFVLTKEMLKKQQACPEGIKNFFAQFHTTNYIELNRENILKIFKLYSEEKIGPLPFGLRAVLDDVQYTHIFRNWCWMNVTDHEAMADYVLKCLRKNNGLTTKK